VYPNRYSAVTRFLPNRRTGITPLARGRFSACITDQARQHRRRFVLRRSFQALASRYGPVTRSSRSRRAKSVIDSVRGEHAEFVFTRAGNPLKGMNNSGWKAARRRAAARYEETLKAPCPNGFRRIRVHDLKHTFGRRLRAACVSFEDRQDRQDLLGHKSANQGAARVERIIRPASRRQRR
jgi:hypothetical protein